MNLILFDDEQRSRFYPLSLTRPISQLRLGIHTLFEKWHRISGFKPSYLVPEYLSTLYPIHLEDDNILINSRLVPNQEIWNRILELPRMGAIRDQERLLVAHYGYLESKNGLSDSIKEIFPLDISYKWLDYLDDVLEFNAGELILDFEVLSKERTSESLSNTNRVLGNQLFITGPIQAEYSTINTETGPVYIENGVQIMEGAMLRGPLAILSESVIKMGAKIYGGSSIGPHCTVGGEVKNVNILGYSNKGHEGYLGDSILGEWCNLGADTNTSNMKNNYGLVRTFDYSLQQMRTTRQRFLGVTMGDHVKCGINSTINTGTVFGMGVNWFGPELSPSFIPDFTWSDSGKFSEYRLDKMLETASKALERRHKILSEADKDLIIKVFEMTKPYRNY